MLNNFPDFSSYGYQVIRDIGQNRAGGRVTYQAVHLESQRPVVIKEFQFAKVGGGWSQYDCYQQEIQVLRGLNHSGIPRYLESFQTPDGFCMIQEYIDALPLSVPRSFEPEEVKQIAIAILEILVYLQNRIPAVIHRDIKPENILVDDAINAYLVDFGFARIGDGEVAVSSVVKGTVGFMPPEQLFNRELTEASDLYGLGATLICLLTQTKSVDIGKLIDLDSRINFKHLVPKLNMRWIKWLEKMVEPRPKDRFPNAATALEALKPIPVSQLPVAQLSHTAIDLQASEMGAKLTQRITVRNPVLTRTPLEGRWEVAPHVSDPPHTPHSHTWISFEPTSFVGNEVESCITVDTSKLRADTVYRRKILLHTNSLPATYTVDLTVTTAPIPFLQRSLPYGLTGLLLLISAPVTWILFWIGRIAGELVGATAIFNMMLAAGGVFGFEIAAGILAFLAMRTGAIASTILGILMALMTVTNLLLREASVSADPAAGITMIDGLGLIAGLAIATLVGLGLGVAAENFAFHHCSSRFSVALTLATALLGVGLGTGMIFGFLNPWIVGSVLVGGGTLAGSFLYQTLLQSRLIAQYRRSERYLIRP